MIQPEFSDNSPEKRLQKRSIFEKIAKLLILRSKPCFKTVLLSFFCIGLFAATINTVAGQDLGNGFFDHGVASPISNHRGTVATVDENGRNVVLVWLFDHRGGYGLLQIDAETGKTQQFPMPFPPGDAVYSSILSKGNKFYTLFKGNFVEFDPVKRAWTFHKETLPQMAMGMTEDKNGVIWAVTYPNSGVISFNPKTRELKDYGYQYKQNWAQYPKYLASDDSGWIYFGLGNTATQIIAFDPATGTSKPMLEEKERKKGIAYVYPDVNGKVYGQARDDKKGEWYEFYKGERTNLGKQHSPDPKPIITGIQGLFYPDFPDGKKLRAVNLIDRKLVVFDPKSGTQKEVSFNYDTEGAWTMGIATSPDGKIVGGTSFPMRFFSYDPKTNEKVNLPALGQFNALANGGNRFYFGVYPSGSFIEWDPSKPWVNTRRGNTNSNPQFIAGLTPVIHRPMRVLAHPDHKAVIMGGTPEYGYTGGGLFFYDRITKKQTLLQDSAVLVDQSTISLVPLKNGKILGGTTTAPGTGGEKKAKEAELYIMDMGSKRMEWHKALFPGVQEYSDMCLASNGLVYGITDKRKFFVFDPVKKAVIHEQSSDENFGRTTGEQSPRIFVKGKNGEIYILFHTSIVKVEPETFKLTKVVDSPVPISAGGDYLEGRIYFVSGSHLCSYQLK